VEGALILGCVCYMYLYTLHTHIGVMQIGTRVHHAFVIHALQLPVASYKKRKEKRGSCMQCKLYIYIDSLQVYMNT
jgi:hypothetical protein